MLKIGIVAEYNPFHNGHLYQIRKIKEIFGEDVLIVVVISGDFVQRGEISFLDKWEKTHASLGCGVDLVVELPLYYSIQNAEIFSRMATKILDYLGIDIQVFGAEEENIEVLQKVLELQKRQDYKDKLMEYMKKGNSYSTSQRLALKEYNLDGIVKSNNILALEYMREIENSNLKIKPYIIKREISEYNEENVSEDREEFASASFLRNELEKILDKFSEEKFDFEKIKNSIIEKKCSFLKDRGVENSKEIVKKNYNFEKKQNIREKIDLESLKNVKTEERIFLKLEEIQKFLPEKSFDIIFKSLEWKINNRFSGDKIKEEIFKIVKYKILTEKIMEIYDITEEIYARIYGTMLNSQKYIEFLKNTKSRNLSNKRVERIILNILLNIKADMMDFEINYVRILGFNKKGQEYLKEIRENNKIENFNMENNFQKKNIFVNWKDIEKSGNFEIQENFLEKIKVEKNGFLIKELILGKKEKLNPIVCLD
ncbi:putative nucleotidyltransferase [Leptotrichia hofstadii]|uniref:tRNA(Met) cytidine acetate ligase n=1 Tax=Leptotrichia hofstadii TaxID=157688 RepID=A0A510JM78_9FUSO|nr:nucleotidyltransferase family protein [Leptotrichia hofstadii]BBM39425.1 putative nucleotidyltransferase [Leptotrichia hofstadii]